MENQVMGLKQVGLTETDEASVLALTLQDMADRQFAAAIDGWGMADLIEHCLQVAANPQFAAATQQQAAQGGPTAQADGSRIEWRPGRSPTEVAATVTVGCLNLVVHLPLGEVLRATAVLVRSIERGPGPTSH
jgi:hypothetical protein